MVPLLAPQPGERILDLGCGTGQLTAKIAESGADVVGVDRSADMIGQARQNYPSIEFKLAEAASFSVPGPFDAVFSNAVLHWIPDAEPVIANVARHLRPGGRFVAEFGGKRNIAALMHAAESVLTRLGKPFEHPWYFPSIGDYAPILERNGFEVQAAWHFDRLTTLDEGEDAMRDWIATFRADWGPYAAEMEEILRPKLYIDGRWHMDYVRLRFQAILTGSGLPR
jgi:trans-aconitate methyltransferase